MRPAIERLVDATTGIDRWCSAPDWTFSTQLGFAPNVEPFVLGDLERWAVVLAEFRDEAGQPVLGGLEPLWGFACPLLLPEPEEHAFEFAEQLGRRAGWDRLVIAGLDAQSDLYFHTVRALSTIGTV
ncbi:MAG: hypothetical protein HKN24_00960, partial [Acidimicrobiales bacterium]|nr:hypothetical protein [Acidimicrobiales bacterium]